MENEHELSYETLTRVYLGSYEHYKSVGAEIFLELIGAKDCCLEWVIEEEVGDEMTSSGYAANLARKKAIVSLPSNKKLLENKHVKRTERIRMSDENQALQRQLLQKQAKELESEERNGSLQSKEQIEAKLLSKFEATMRRERAMSYSFSHQQPWKKTARNKNLLFMDPTNPQWGWSWLERYMAGRPLGTQGDKDHKSVKNGINITQLEIAKSYTSRQLSSTLVASRKFKCGPSHKRQGPADDSKSIFSVQSEMNKRHSIASYSVRDDESMYSYTSIPSYMMQTKSKRLNQRVRVCWVLLKMVAPKRSLGQRNDFHFLDRQLDQGAIRVHQGYKEAVESINSAAELKEVFLSACGLLIKGQRELKLA
ncbi:hypothetical protein Tco_0658570 [Tanacetum coccineum]